MIPLKGGLNGVQQGSWLRSRTSVPLQYSVLLFPAYCRIIRLLNVASFNTNHLLCKKPASVFPTRLGIHRWDFRGSANVSHNHWRVAVQTVAIYASRRAFNGECVQTVIGCAGLDYRG